MRVETKELWKTLDELVPMPISKTRDRVCSWLAVVRAVGLITYEEQVVLCEQDMEEREELMRSR